MNYEEILTKLKNPDKLAEGIADLDAYVKDLNNQHEADAAKLKENEKSISDLKESNWNLLLKITGEPEKKEETEELTPYEELVKALTNESEDNSNGN